VSSLLHDPKNRVPFKRRMRFARDTALAMNAMHLSNPAILYALLNPRLHLGFSVVPRMRLSLTVGPFLVA
jgi:hypothetical protein